eukprot:TRINITY_DN75607_c0_g1_i1.p2 TRINITY_DN75607_c0_g1~~TRINITY_DN75607_c0_g1_i1.p2  ORF type:complete len:161 (-),score=15.88 TRINITY_DN75607_c0_g1_i1:62-544(-)
MKAATSRCTQQYLQADVSVPSRRHAGTTHENADPLGSIRHLGRICSCPPLGLLRLSFRLASLARARHFLTFAVLMCAAIFSSAMADYQHQVVDITVKDNTDTEIDAWKHFESEKEAARRRERPTELDNSAVGKIDAALAPFNFLSIFFFLLYIAYISKTT